MLSFLLAASLAFSPQDAHLAHSFASNLVVRCTPRDAATPGARLASDFIFEHVRRLGADVRQDVFRAATADGERTFVNVVAEFRGAADAGWVVLLSHFDTKPGVNCPGANDGAATSGLLVALAAARKRCRDLKANLLFVWTDGEESRREYGPKDGLWGSRHAADVVAARRLDVRAVICADMLGDRDLRITIPANGSPALTATALRAARRLGCPELVTTTDLYVTDDHVAFLEKGYKAVDLVDFSYGPDNAWWHTSRDTMENVSEASLLKSGRLIAEMLNLLDD